MSFSTLFEKFKKTRLWDNMTKCVENSPWHREANTAVHTEMVLEVLHDLAFRDTDFSSREFNITAVAAMFHDTGKPNSRREKETEERGKYFVFSGHEQVSARLFEDFYCSNEQMFTGVLNREDFYKVVWLIENHLPYQIKRDEKFQSMRDAVEYNLDGMSKTFLYHLVSDGRGRISDPDKDKREAPQEWFDLLMSLDPSERRWFTDATPTLYVLIGASGSGKSSFSKKKADANYFSLDASRIRYALENGVEPGFMEPVTYRRAWEYCDTHRSMFRHNADVEFMVKLKEYKDLIIDNTNVSRKTRAMYITEARKRGYRVVGVMFPISESELYRRLSVRADKKIPLEALDRQYMTLTVPNVGAEVDELVVCWDNLEKR